MSLYEKMFNVMNDSEAIEKSMEVGTGKNAYKAVSEAAILNMVKPLFKKYKLIIFPISGDIKDHCMTWDKTDYDGKTAQTLRAVTELKVTYRIMDIESKEYQDVVGFGNGADSQDKGSGKASTYSLKNALSKTFMLFSGEDTDNTHSDDIGGYTPPKADKPKDTGTANGEIISRPQANRIFALSGGNADICKEVLKTFGYTKSDEVQKKHYEAICKAVQEVAAKADSDKDKLPWKD
jgi:hypothetical protein